MTIQKSKLAVWLQHDATRSNIGWAISSLEQGKPFATSCNMMQHTCNTIIWACSSPSSNVSHSREKSETTSGFMSSRNKSLSVWSACVAVCWKMFAIYHMCSFWQYVYATCTCVCECMCLYECMCLCVCACINVCNTQTHSCTHSWQTVQRHAQYIHIHNAHNHV